MGYKMYNLKVIKVDSVDERMMMNECRDIFIKFHPVFEGMHMSRRFMFKKVVQHFIESGNK